jgi:hypothetical protein
MSGITKPGMRGYRARRCWDVFARLSLTAVKMSVVVTEVFTPGTSKGEPARGLGITVNKSPPRLRMSTASSFDWFSTSAKFCLAWE